MTNGEKGRIATFGESFSEQWPSLRFVGFGIWWAWIWLAYHSVELTRNYPASDQTSFVLTMYLCSTIGIAFAMAIASVFWKRWSVFVNDNRFVIISGVVASVATAVLGVSGYLGLKSLFAICAVITGIGTSALCLKSGCIYGTIGLKESLSTAAASTVVACFLYFVAIGIPEVLRLPFISLLPVISALVLCLPEGDGDFTAPPQPQEWGDKSSPQHRAYRRLLVATALVSLAAGIGKGLASSSTTPDEFAHIGMITVLTVGLIAGIVMLVMSTGGPVKRTVQVYSALMVLTIAIPLTSCFGFNLAYINIGKESLWFVFSCLMAYMVFRFDFSPVRAFGFGQAFYFLFSTAGWAIGAALTTYYRLSTVRLAAGMIFSFLFVVVLVFVFTGEDIKATARLSGSRIEKRRRTRNVLTAGIPAGVVEDEAVLGSFEIDSSYGLSVRELEVLELFAQGRSANWIADDLTISKNTVRSHLRAIYVKLDVHTRQELLDFLMTKR